MEQSNIAGFLQERRPSFVNSDCKKNKQIKLDVAPSL